MAYADFVTAMMAFFLVMWITAQSKDMKQAIAHHFNDPFAPVSEDESDSEHLKPTKYSAPARPSQADEKEAGGGGRSLLLVSQGGDRTSIGTVVHFAEESVELDAAARKNLEIFAPYVLGKPQRIEIRGHSTRRPLSAGSSFSDHWQLAYARCQAVMAALDELGVPRERMRLSQAAGNEPATAPDSQVAGGGHARVEVNLLNETAAPVKDKSRVRGSNAGSGLKRGMRRSTEAESEAEVHPPAEGGHSDHGAPKAGPKEPHAAAAHAAH